MSNSQRILTAISLLLVAAGIGFGLFHAAVVRYNTMPVLQYGSHWTAASLAAQNGPEEAIQAAKDKSYQYTRVIDAHTHIIKLATVLLLVALLYPLVGLPDKHKRTLAATLVIGMCVFPLGVLAEIYVPGLFGQATAAFGALLVIIAFGAFTWGILRGPTSPSSGGSGPHPGTPTFGPERTPH